MIHVFVALSYDKTNGPITKVHTYVNSFLNGKKFRVYMFERLKDKHMPNHIIPLKLPRLKKYPFSLSTYKNMKNLIESLISLQTDIIHTVIYPEIFPMILIRRLLKLDKKMVLSFHGVPLDSYKHFAISKLLSKRASAITSVSHFTAKLVKDIYNLDSVVIHNGVDTNYYHPNEHFNNRPRVLFVGRFVKWKNPHWVAKLAKKFPNADFIIHGKPPKTGISVYPLLLEIAQHTPNLKISTEYLNTDKLRQLYQESDIFCYPSTDWHPLSVMEAMACGLPLVVHGIGGQSELIENGKEGFKINSFKDMEENVRYLLEDENLRKDIAKNARLKALQYDWKNVAKRYEKFYERVAMG